MEGLKIYYHRRFCLPNAVMLSSKKKRTFWFFFYRGIWAAWSLGSPSVCEEGRRAEGVNLHFQKILIPAWSVVFNHCSQFYTRSRYPEDGFYWYLQCCNTTWFAVKEVGVEIEAVCRSWDFALEGMWASGEGETADFSWSCPDEVSPVRFHWNAWKQ